MPRRVQVVVEEFLVLLVIMASPIIVFIGVTSDGGGRDSVVAGLVMAMIVAGLVSVAETRRLSPDELADVRVLCRWPRRTATAMSERRLSSPELAELFANVAFVDQVRIQPEGVRIEFASPHRGDPDLVMVRPDETARVYQITSRSKRFIPIQDNGRNSRNVRAVVAAIQCAARGSRGNGA